MEDDLLVKLVEAGLRFVSIHPRTQKEIRTYFTKKLERYRSKDTALIDQACQRLLELGYVDDEAYARAFIASRNAHNPKGSRLLVLELKSRGVAPEVITTVLGETGTDQPEAELERAATLVEKHKTWRMLPGPERTRKLYAYLSRRGFSGDVIRRVIDLAAKKDYNRHTL